jgi:hypothetical protein
VVVESFFIQLHRSHRGSQDASVGRREGVSPTGYGHASVLSPKVLAGPVEGPLRIVIIALLSTYGTVNTKRLADTRMQKIVIFLTLSCSLDLFVLSFDQLPKDYV